MSNLRVTDVQALLRKFAGLGHDVTSDPRAVNLEGRSYGVPVGHFLNIQPLSTRSDKYHTLTSFVPQREKPVVSSIFTAYVPNEKTGLDRVAREVSPMTPYRMKGFGGSGSDRDEFMSHDFPYSESKGWYGAESVAPSGSLLWTPNSRNTHKDVHEALEHHATGDFPYGTLDDEYEGLADMVPEDKFDFKTATSNLVTPAVPYKGLITIGHSIGSNRSAYVYNPETEQMFRHGDYGA